MGVKDVESPIEGLCDGWKVGGERIASIVGTDDGTCVDGVGEGCTEDGVAE